MAKKVNNYLARRDAALERDYKLKLRIQEQLLADSACMAAAEVFHIGPGRAKRFMDAWSRWTYEILKLTDEDAEADPDLVYTKAKVDERIKEIVGEENFVPWEKRYV